MRTLMPPPQRAQAAVAQLDAERAVAVSARVRGGGGGLAARNARAAVGRVVGWGGAQDVERERLRSDALKWELARLAAYKVA